jgi:DNA mismatch endonuclease (patch repair protein)
MADTVSKKRRSEIMSNVKSSHTKPEILVRKFLFSNGIRFRLHDKKLPGKPDLKIPKYNTVVFINGCFWHGHKLCKIYVMPKTNKSFWYSKIENNIDRDRKNKRRLRRLGWKVITVWECDLKPKKRLATLQKLVNNILENAK